MLTIAILVATIGVVAANDPPCFQSYSLTIEGPCYTSVRNASDYAVRRYGPNKLFWSTAYVNSTDFDTVENDGFDTNFNYISGDNDKNEKIPMTSPVINRSPDLEHWAVSFYAPSNFKTYESVPKSKIVDIIQTPEDYLVAVVTFGGFAQEADFKEKESQLRAALERDGVKTREGEWGRVWAGYDPPFRLFDRHNEVWVQIEA